MQVEMSRAVTHPKANRETGEMHEEQILLPRWRTRYGFGTAAPEAAALDSSNSRCSRQKRDQDSYPAGSFTASTIGMNSGPTMPLRRPATDSLASCTTCTTPKCTQP